MIGCIAQKGPRRAVRSRLIVRRERRVTLRLLEENRESSKIRRHVHAEQSVEWLRTEVLRADVLPRRKTGGMVEHQLLGDVAETLVEPRLLVDGRVVHVQATAEID